MRYVRRWAGGVAIAGAMVGAASPAAAQIALVGGVPSAGSPAHAVRPLHGTIGVLDPGLYKATLPHGTDATPAHGPLHPVGGNTSGYHGTVPNGTFHPQVTTTPEPATFTLVASGVAGLAWIGLRRRRDI